MSRITQTFTGLRDSGRKGFIPFVTAGDPDLETSLAIVLRLAELGVDVIELGVPFSDPMADGPTIQRSSERALAGGVTLVKVLELAAAIREHSNVPLVLFSYFNPILRMGPEKFTKAAAAVGIDGVLMTDVIEDEAKAVSSRFAGEGIDLISLVAPTTTGERLARICDNARGFIYAVSRAGVTGAQVSTSSAAAELVARTRQFTDLPVAVGFGISTAEQIVEVWEYADAAVVGSAIVSEIEGSGHPLADLDSFIRQLLPQFAKMRGQN